MERPTSPCFVVEVVTAYSPNELTAAVVVAVATAVSVDFASIVFVAVFVADLRRMS